MGQQREKQTNLKSQGENRLIPYLCIVPSHKIFESLQRNVFNDHVFSRHNVSGIPFPGLKSRSNGSRLAAAECLETIMMVMGIRALQTIK